MSRAAAAKSHQVIDFGCRLNIAEGERITHLLRSVMPDQQTIVINSCGVTAQAVRSARSRIRRARRDHPESRLVVTGCAAQIDPASFAAMPEVDRVIGNAEKLMPASYACNGRAEAPRIDVRDIMALTRTAPQMLPAFDGHTRAFLEVQNGCDHRCTFCVIPFGRGPSRSTPVEQIVATASRLAQDGHREMVLTGVDLTSYRPDGSEGGSTLAGLCRRLLDDIPAIDRLRLGSIDVAEIDDALFDLLTGEPRMMPHVHLSLQSGDDLMLKRMKRRHRRNDAVRMVDRLKSRRPEIAIGADLIAGFPTEDEQAALNSRTLIDACDIVFAHIFPYSPRDGTPAARMPQLDRALIKERAAQLRAVAMSHQHLWLNAMIGTRQMLLIESDGKSGHVANFARMRIDGCMSPGSIVAAQVTGVEGATLVGQAITGMAQADE